MTERVRLYGPPGTGKTRYLIEICKIEIADGRRPGEIIFCSFTKAAAHEARNRAIEAFGGNRDDYQWFSTEHSICYRLLGLKREQVLTPRRLRLFGEPYNYGFSDDNVQEDTEERFNEGMLRSVADHYEAFIAYMTNRMMNFGDAYREFIRDRDVPDGFTRAGLGVYIERREKYKQEYSLWSFDDMIVGALQQDIIPPGVKVLVADEMQDCSPLLYKLVRRWSERVENYYVAADPLQAIYGFAGASPDLFFDFPGEEEVLHHSYRLTPEVKDFARQIIERAHLPFPEYTAADRRGAVARQPFQAVPWKDAGQCFVLARTRWLLSLASDHFLTLGIPFKNERGHHSPLGTSTGRAFHVLVKLAGGEGVSEHELASLAKHTGPPYLKRGAKTRVKNLVGGRYQAADLPVMGFTDAFMKAVRGGSFEDVLCKDIEEDERAYLVRVFEHSGREAFEKEPRIVLTTIHGSKGREMPTVYLCPDLTRRVEEGYAHDKKSESLVWYVAATRAVEKLVVLSPQQEYMFPLPRIGSKG